MSEPVIITARASSLPMLADCAARWYATQVEGITTPPSPRAFMGNGIHAGTAAHDQARIDGSPLRADESAGAAIDYLREHRDEVDWRPEDDGDVLRFRDVERITIALHTRYCAEIAPTRIYTAVEPTLGAVEVETDTGVIVRLTGQADRAREEWVGGDLTEIVSDVKSGVRAVRADGTVEVKGHAYQVGAYKVLRRMATRLTMNRRTEIIGLNTGMTPDTQRVGVGVCEDAEETLIGTEDRPGLLHALAWMARSGVFHGNPKSSLCTPRYCPIYHSCHYRK